MPDDRSGQFKLRGFARLTLDDLDRMIAIIENRKNQTEQDFDLKQKLETILREERG